MSKPVNLIVDLNNLAWICRFSQLPTPPSALKKDPFATQIIFRNMLDTILNIAKQNKATGVVIARDARNTWRRDLYPEYKQKVDEQDVYKEEVFTAADTLCKFFDECTAAKTILVEKAEADDIIAVWTQESEGVENVIVSTDKDFIQLYSETTQIYSPVQKIYRTSENPSYDLFEKCIRGDSSDNIRSAYPRVRKTVLQEAWEDPYKMMNLMNTVTKDGSVVKDNFDFNSVLIDLSKQPKELRDEILFEIRKEVTGKYRESNALRFLKDLGFKDHLNAFDFKDSCLKKPPVFCNK